MKFLLLLFAVCSYGQVATDTTLAAHPANAFFLISMNPANGTVIPTMAPAGPGGSAMNLALSPDGINWGNPVYQFDLTNCNDGVSGAGIGYCARDPGIGKFANNGWIPYTCAGQSGANNQAQWCLTKIDLAACFASISTCTFSTVAYVSTSAFSASLRDWRPHWVVNADNTVFLNGSGCPSITYSATDASTVFEIAEMHPTGSCTSATDFGAATWSTPVVLTHMDTNMIDSFTVWDGTNFNLFYVDIVFSTNQSIQYGTSATITGTYTKQSSGVNWTGFQLGGQINQEGPSLLCATYSGSFPSGSCTKWRMYFDQIGAAVGNLIAGQINYSETTAGFGSGWSAPIPINTATQAKNGMVIPYP